MMKMARQCLIFRAHKKQYKTTRMTSPKARGSVGWGSVSTTTVTSSHNNKLPLYQRATPPKPYSYRKATTTDLPTSTGAFTQPQEWTEDQILPINEQGPISSSAVEDGNEDAALLSQFASALHRMVHKISPPHTVPTHAPTHSTMSSKLDHSVSQTRKETSDKSTNTVAVVAVDNETTPVIARKTARLDNVSSALSVQESLSHAIISEMQLDHTLGETLNERKYYSNTSRPQTWTVHLDLSQVGYPHETCVLTSSCVYHVNPGMNFVLEPTAIVERTFERSYYTSFKQFALNPSFLFKLNYASHFLMEAWGMKRSFSIKIRDLNSSNPDEWSLHFKPEGNEVKAYLIKPEEMRMVIQEAARALLASKRLPLILDLDDTLVRVITEVPTDEVDRQRMRILPDGRKILLARDSIKFLTWAKTFFQLSICSLGERSYVDQVVETLDPNGSLIEGEVYSSREEYSHLQRSQRERLYPPKNMYSVFPFGMDDEADVKFPDIRPLIIDDTCNVWPADQQDHIIVVKKMKRSSVWDVSFFPTVQSLLAQVHESFFRKLTSFQEAVPDSIETDANVVVSEYDEYLRMSTTRRGGGGEGGGAGEEEMRYSAPALHAPAPPSMVALYKKWLRGQVADRMADSM